MTYTPNFTDPRVERRITHALGFCIACLGQKPGRWAKVALDKHFGQSQNPVSSWLRRVLLITLDDHYSMDDGIPKLYCLNQSGVTYLKAVLKDGLRTDWETWTNNRDRGINSKAGTNQQTDTSSTTNSSWLAAPAPSVLQVSDPVFDQAVVDAWAGREFGDELKHLAFTYEDKSSRLWHPLQSVRREHKKRIQAAAGLTWHYDIEAAAPTLLLQHSQSLPEVPGKGIWPMDLWLFAYQFYLSNRQAARARLAELLEVDVSYAKTVLNSLFCGAKVGAGQDFSLFRLLGTVQRIDLLKNDPFIQGLRQDIKTVWAHIEPTMMRIEKQDKNGRTYKVPLSSRRKWGLYFDLERRVLDAVREYLTETGNPHFLEHDGWATRDRVDVTALVEHIRHRTGFTIKLEEEHYP